MGTKNNPGAFDCYVAAKPDEPMFVLLGRDPMAASLVRRWAVARYYEGEETAKVIEALDCADALEAWAREAGKIPRTAASGGDNADRAVGRCSAMAAFTMACASSNLSIFSPEVWIRRWILEGQK
jgi:hypothetical protein